MKISHINTCMTSNKVMSLFDVRLKTAGEIRGLLSAIDEDHLITFNNHDSINVRLNTYGLGWIRHKVISEWMDKKRPTTSFFAIRRFDPFIHYVFIKKCLRWGMQVTLKIQHLLDEDV